MNSMRERAKEHFPAVLLTLLSIVQALALELLWAYLREADDLLVASWSAVAPWLQVTATFLGILLIWVVYAGNVMRFRWVPATSDSVYPFLIGLVEFMLIESLGAADEVGLWLISLGLIFALMNWVAHTTMRRARQDGDNDAYFRNFARAGVRDFYPAIATVIGLSLVGGYLQLTGGNGALAMVALLLANVMLAWQFYQTARFWRRSVREE